MRIFGGMARVWLTAAAGALYLLATPLAAFGGEEGKRLVPVTETPVDISGWAAPDAHAAQANQKRLEQLTALGQALFHDRRLSSSGQLSCASCHDPAHAFSPANGHAVQRGGKRMAGFGTRAVPGLMYLQTSPVFTLHGFEDEGARAGQDNGPTGGFTWDGRVDSLQAQALLPLFAANEMASTPAHVQRVVQRAGYADLFAQLFGPDSLQQAGSVAEQVALALQTYQQSAPVFYPYTSKYDAVLRGKARLSRQEARGLDVFNREDKGNCASCHPSAISANGAFPQFTDYGYANLGLPRNKRIPANQNPRYFDKGLCGPLRQDLADLADYCGMFKVPTLRNVALKKVFYHNASATDLTSAVRFYAERDTRPQRWYPRDAHGRLLRFNDLPPDQRYALEMEAPFGQKPGEASPLTAADVRDIVAFLKTLTDGYRP